MNHHPRQRSGFTLIELVIVILVLSVLAGVAVPKITNRIASARDARRMQDVTTLREAIDQYYLDKGVYPTANGSASFGGWDVSQDGNFIEQLITTGYLRERVSDPVNDATYHYRYYVYAKDAYGCKGSGPFYVLGVIKFETKDMSDKNNGYFRCTGRDWSSEFDYVTGGGASYE